MYIAIDVIIAAVIAACIYGAVKNGFVVTLFKMLSAVAALIVAFMFYGELGEYFGEEFVHSTVEKYVAEFIGQNVEAIGSAANANELMESLPEGIRTAVDLLGIDVTELLGNASNAESALAESLSREISGALSGVLAFAALFFGSLIVLGLVCFILNTLSKLPVLNGANKLLGFAFGVCEALLLGMVIARVSASLCGAYGAIDDTFLFAEVEKNTYLARFLISFCPF